MPLTAGSRLGPYEIVAPLGAGGMGEVYRARDPRLGRDVAIKVIAPLEASAGPSADRLRRFEREARAVAALSHPNVLAIFDIGVGDVPFLVTELLEGETLRRVIERGPLPPSQVTGFGLQLVAGLAAAHDRHIVHRDLKPENIIVGPDGRLKVLDFGLAAQRSPAAEGEADATLAQTQPGAVLGTFGYMAPEQVRGQAADHRTDLFAAGAILYEMLTGKRAFDGESPADTMSAVLNDPPAALVFGPTVPLALERIVRQCLEKDPAQRFQSARDLGYALQSASDLRAPAPTAAERPETRSVAVLPFANFSADPDHLYFSDGLAEDLINALTRLAGLKVASRTSSFRFRARDLDIREIGGDLGVGAIVEGSVRRAGDRLRITVQLTSTSDGYHLWSERYDRKMADIFDVQDEIVEAIVAALAPTLVPRAYEAVAHPTDNLQAYELYLQGRYYWNQRSPAVVGAAIRCFKDAIALDPDYALPYAGLADSYAILRVYGWTPPEQTRPLALEAVTTALSLQPDLPDARLSQALYTFYFDRQWLQARRHFVDALAAAPQSAAFEAYYGLFLATAYDDDDAARHLERAEALDPHSSVVHFLAACAGCLTGDIDSVERHVSRALTLQPESLGPRWPQTVSLAAAGRLDEAMIVGEQVLARTRAPIYIGVMAMVYGLAGRVDAARRLGQELDERESRGEYIVPVARLSIALGVKDVAGIRAALRECVNGGAAPLSVAATSRPFIDVYRDDPEIDGLLDRLHDGARPVQTSN